MSSDHAHKFFLGKRQPGKIWLAAASSPLNIIASPHRRYGRDININPAPLGKAYPAFKAWALIEIFMAVNRHIHAINADMRRSIHHCLSDHVNCRAGQVMSAIKITSSVKIEFLDMRSFNGEFIPNDHWNALGRHILGVTQWVTMLGKIVMYLENPGNTLVIKPVYSIAQHPYFPRRIIKRGQKFRRRRAANYCNLFHAALKKRRQGRFKPLPV